MTKRSPKIFVCSMTCPRRLLDADKIINYFLQNGCEIVFKPARANFIFINTCAFNKLQADLALENIKRFKKYKSKIIVGGCLSVVELQRIGSLSLLAKVSPSDINKIDNLFNFGKKFKDLPDSNLLSPAIMRSSAWLMDGVSPQIGYPGAVGDLCNPFQIYYIRPCAGCYLRKCTYCGIKKAVGPLKSKPIEECLREFKIGLQKKYKYFRIEGEDVGAYGLDIKESLPNLLKKILKIRGNYRIDINCIHPVWLIRYEDALVKLVETKKIVRIVMPIQSGSDRILRLMGRDYTIRQVKFVISRLRKSCPKLRIQTHIIIGFPGEGEKDFCQSLKLLKEMNFNNIIFYVYSERPDTPAAAFSNKIPPVIIKKRIKKIKTFGLKNYHIIM